MLPAVALGVFKSGPDPVIPAPPVFIVDAIPRFIPSILIRFWSAVSVGFGSAGVGKGAGAGGGGGAGISCDLGLLKMHISFSPLGKGYSYESELR